MSRTYHYTGEPLRLDKVLGFFLPHLGLRGRRRLIENGFVLVMGHPRTPAYVVRTAADITVLDPTSEDPASGTNRLCSLPKKLSAHATSESTPSTCDTTIARESARLLEQQGDYCFFFKPAGLHSTALAGGSDTSLEALLAALMQNSPLRSVSSDSFLSTPPLASQHPASTSPEPSPSTCYSLPQLLQRLDKGTSGIVAAAIHPAAAMIWRNAEAHGLCSKRYLALLRGRLPAEQLVTAALDTQQRKRTRILLQQGDPLRHTHFTPLLHFTGTAAQALQDRLAPDNLPAAHLTLAGCSIHRGARHQIRAHAASLGTPLWGDSLYGGGIGQFFLHHGGMDFLGQHVVLMPAWATLLPPQQQLLLHRWLEGHNTSR